MLSRGDSLISMSAHAQCRSFPHYVICNVNIAKMWWCLQTNDVYTLGGRKVKGDVFKPLFSPGINDFAKCTAKPQIEANLGETLGTRVSSNFLSFSCSFGKKLCESIYAWHPLCIEIPVTVTAGFVQNIYSVCVLENGGRIRTLHDVSFLSGSQNEIALPLHVITNFCGHFTYIYRNIMKVENVFFFRHTFFVTIWSLVELFRETFYNNSLLLKLQT